MAGRPHPFAGAAVHLFLCPFPFPCSCSLPCFRATAAVFERAADHLVAFESSFESGETWRENMVAWTCAVPDQVLQWTVDGTPLERTSAMTREITNNDDIIDSRDVTERIADLEAEHERDDDEQDELDALRRLAAEGESLPDWPYSAGLIRDSYFEDHARDLAEDIGAIPADASWPATCIDWERAARELRMDYTSIDFDGVTYWSR